METLPLAKSGPPKFRLDVSRDGLKGCRMGRFAAESSIAEISLRKPVER
jgi:hypothetical protein